MGVVTDLHLAFQLTFDLGYPLGTGKNIVESESSESLYVTAIHLPLRDLK